MQNNIEFELLMELKKTRSILINPASKEFISYSSGRITTPINIDNGFLNPSLYLNKNATTLRICQEFQDTALYLDQNGEKNGSLEYGFTDNGENLFCKITDFSGVINPETPDMQRIIQFDQNSNNSLPIQWDKLKPYIKWCYQVKYNNKIPDILNYKIFWTNLEPEGFIICAVNPAEKTLIVSIPNQFNRLIGNAKKQDNNNNNINMIAAFWPELKIRKEFKLDQISILSDELLNKFPEIQSGIIRVTKYHSSDLIITSQTHISCC